MALWSLKGKKVLVVDDLAEMRASLRNMALAYGSDNITTSSTGEEAIAKLCLKYFDIVLCDYNLGAGKDGQQVLEEAKHRNRLPYSTVFIMVTAENTSMMVMGALEYQPDEYLSKPFTRAILQSRLQKQLAKKETLKPLSRALSQKNTPKALQICEGLIEKNPRNKNELLKLKCELLIEEKEYSQAEEICKEVLGKHPILWAQFLGGKILLLQQEYSQAQTVFETIIEENENFIAAYDFLSECQQHLNETAAAQRTLEDALEKSPKSVTRQRALAEAAEKNNDLETAELARRKTIRIGKNSVLRQATDFTKLAEVQIENDEGKDALRTIDLMKSEFKGDEPAKLSATLAKSKIHTEMGNEKLAVKSTQEAIELFEKNPSVVSNEQALDLTQACLQHGDTDEANKIALHIASNNHDDPSLLDNINNMYKASGVDQDASILIEGVRREITETNNKGVDLLSSGKLDKSINLFEKALEKGPNNQVLNINSAQAYLMKIKKSGHSDELMEKARSSLDKTQNNPKMTERYKALNAIYWTAFNAAAKR